jgi:hypothetical protein
MSDSSCSCAAPGFFDREMWRGDSHIFDVTVLKSDGCTPQDITGWTAWFTAKEHVALQDSAATIRLGNILPLTGIVLTFPTQGKMRITVPPSATINCPDTPLCLFYDVQVKDVAGNVFTIERGTLTVKPDVTRSI